MKNMSYPKKLIVILKLYSKKMSKAKNINFAIKVF